MIHGASGIGQGGKWVRRILMKYIPWLAFGCSLVLLLSANSATYALEFFNCRGLPLVYEKGISGKVLTLFAVPPVFRPLALDIDILVAFVVSSLVGLFVSRFGTTQRVPRIIFVLAILLFAAANVVFIFIWSGPKGIVGPSYRVINDWAPYYYCLMLAPSLVLTMSGLVWLLVSARRRRPQPSSVTQ